MKISVAYRIKKLYQNKEQKKMLFRPIMFVQIYLLGIIVLYLIGPLEWQTKNSYLLFPFLFLSQLLLYLGYKSSMRHNIIENADNHEDLNVKFQKYLTIMIPINLVFVILNTIRNIGMSGFSMNTLLYLLQEGLMSPGKQFYNKFGIATFGGEILAPITVLLSPFLWPVIPLSIYYFKKLSLFNKVLTIVTLFFEATRWIATGTNKGLIDIILIICTVILVKYLQNRYSNNSASQQKKYTSKIKMYIIGFVLIVAGITFFSNAIGDRIGGISGFSSVTNNYVLNAESPLMMISPKFLYPTIVYTTSYLTQGYYGLSLALLEPWVPMFGVGNSMFLIANLQDLFGVDLFQYTYQARIAYLGWDSLVNWHSFYMWVANDIHFIGILPLMYLLGKFFGSVSKEVIINQNPIACVIFCLLMLMFFYFPANNQIMSQPESFMAFWVVTLYWMLKKVKIRI